MDILEERRLGEVLQEEDLKVGIPVRCDFEDTTFLLEKKQH